MQSQTGLWVAMIVVAIIAIGGYMYPSVQQSQNVGGVSNYDNLQLSNAGTSTLTRVGCYQGYATSTASPIIMTFGQQGTSTITGTSPAQGVMTWQFGTCGSPVGL